MCTTVQDQPTEAMKKLKSYWTDLIYRKEEEIELLDLKWKFFSNLTGQGVFICGMHNLPLTKDLVKSGFFCRGRRVSHLRCPIPNSSSCVCRQHFDEGLKTPNRRVVHGKLPMKLDEKKTRKLIVENLKRQKSIVVRTCCLKMFQCRVKIGRRRRHLLPVHEERRGG